MWHCTGGISRESIRPQLEFVSSQLDIREKRDILSLVNE